jgi:hypothetical protein
MPWENKGGGGPWGGGGGGSGGPLEILGLVRQEVGEARARAFAVTARLEEVHELDRELPIARWIGA